MNRVTLWGCTILALALPVGCNATSNGRFGTLTPTGPKVQGSSIGTQMFLGPNGEVPGTVYDSDGDGRADEVDLDGDGLSDGEDIDGDGIITVWRNLVSGDDVATPAILDKEVQSTPAPVLQLFASKAPLPGESATGVTVGTTAGVSLVSGTIPTGKPGPGVLAARSQGNLGSCGAFTTAAAVVLARYSNEKKTNPAVDINSLWSAPLYIYQYNATFDTAKKECSGTNISANLNRFMLYGAPAEAELMYPGPGMDSPKPQFCSTPATDAAANSPSREANRIGGHVAIAGKGMTWRNEVKRQLSMGRPIAFGVNLPMGFDAWRSTTLGTDGNPTDVTQVFRGGGQCTGLHCDGHAMVITAYDDTRSAYRVLNSWGSDWGDNGYIWWDYASLEALPNLHASAVIPLPAGTPALGTTSPANITVSLAQGTTPAYAKLQARSDGTAYWGIIARVQWNEPVTVTQVLSDINGNQFSSGLSQSMLTGDVEGLVIGSSDAGFDPMSIVGQMVTLTITATARDGTSITRVLGPFTAPMPTT